MARDPVRKALGVVLDKMPISIRELARRAGVSHVLLLQARAGEAKLTPDVAQRVVKALREMSEEMAGLADLLEEATQKRGDR
jgi:hypothetical protein